MAKKKSDIPEEVRVGDAVYYVVHDDGRIVSLTVRKVTPQRIAFEDHSQCYLASVSKQNLGVIQTRPDGFQYSVHADRRKALEAAIGPARKFVERAKSVKVELARMERELAKFAK